MPRAKQQPCNDYRIVSIGGHRFYLAYTGQDEITKIGGRGCLGVCQDARMYGKPKVLVDKSISLADRIHVTIHELIHAYDFDKTEEAVDAAGQAIFESVMLLLVNAGIDIPDK